MTQDSAEQVITHADKLERVRLGKKGGHPIMVEWLDAGDLRNEVVYVCKVGRETEEIVMATEIVETNFDKILRVNGALTTYGGAYYKLVDYLDGKKGEVIRVKYTKKRTGEVRNYTGIVLGVKDRRYLAIRVDGSYRQLLIANIELLG